MQSFRLTLIAIAFVITLAGSHLRAATMTFTDRMMFENTLNGPTKMEGFEDEAVDVQEVSRLLHFAFFDVHYVRHPYPNPANPPAGFGVTDFAGVAGPSEGSQYLLTDFGVSANVPTVHVFTLHTPVFAFGMNLQGKGVFDLYFATDTGVADLALPASGSVDSVQFWGITSDEPITQIVFQADSTSQGRDGAGFDDIILLPVPEPATSMLLLAAGGLLVRRRSSRNEAIR